MSQPDFDHLCLESGTTQVTKWSNYIRPRAEELCEILYRTRSTWGFCPFCEVEYPLDISGHIAGKRHLKKVQQRLNYREPQSPIQLQEYIQVWELQFAYGVAEPLYHFNHLTGEHGFGSGGTQRTGSSADGRESRRPTAFEAPQFEGDRPDFGFLCLEGRDYAPWTTFIQPSADKLMDMLYETRSSWGHCLVCDKEYPASLSSHIKGKSHLKCLHAKLNYRQPRTPAQLREFTQVWDLEYGYGENPPHYHFNHITGRLGFGLGPDGARSSDMGASASSGSHSIPSAMSARDGSAINRTLQGWSLQLPGQTYDPPAPGAHSNGRPPDVPAPTSYHPMDYKIGLENLTAWRTFMETPSKKLEDTLYNTTGRWAFSCAACDKSMCHGAHQHMVSKDHFWVLWNQFDCRELPDADTVAGLKDQPWVARFDTPRGDYLFNLLTGEQSFANELVTV